MFVYSSEAGGRLGKRRSSCMASIQGKLKGRRREGIEQFWVRGTSWSGLMNRYCVNIFPRNISKLSLLFLFHKAYI